jgi:Kef-type K+ transport system membrane component KefB
MSTASFNGLLIISVIAVMAPILAASVRRVKLPSAVVEIVAGIIIGPSVLAWVRSISRSPWWRCLAWPSCSSWPGWRSTCGR